MSSGSLTLAHWPKLPTDARPGHESVEDYQRRNLLRSEVTSADVAWMVRVMVDVIFRSTTGAQVAVDGGSEPTL